MTARNGPRLRMRRRNQRGPSYTCLDMVESAMAGGYGVPARSHRHPRVAPAGPTGTADVVVLAVVVALAIATRWWPVVPAAGLAVAVVRSPRIAAVAVVLAAVAVPRATAAWAGLRPDALGPFLGWAEVV